MIVQLWTQVPNQRLKSQFSKIYFLDGMVAIKDLRLELTSLLMTRNLLDPVY